MNYRSWTLLAVAVVIASAFAWWFCARRDPEEPSPFPFAKTDAEWRGQLTAEQYRVTRQKGTERAFTGAYWNCKTPGDYVCIGCAQPLFDSTTKYESGTGWPSFWQPVAPANVVLNEEGGWLGARVEVVCSNCGAHLGHVFDDGPPPTGKRYCMNSAALRLIARPGGDEHGPAAETK